MRYLLDTSAFSAAMRREPEILAFLDQYRPGNIVTAPPVAAEIEYGIARLAPSAKKRLLLEAEKEKLFGVIAVLPWTSSASASFGRVKAELERAGTLIDDFDIAIAAIAMSHQAAVVTANLVHFSRIEGLEARRWG